MIAVISGEVEMDFQEARNNIGVGWYMILNNLYRIKPAGCVITGVSRVDGRLHITVSGITTIYRAIIRMAEDQSARTCEECGSSRGRQRKFGTQQIFTLCDACHQLRLSRFGGADAACRTLRGGCPAPADQASGPYYSDATDSKHQSVPRAWPTS